MIGTNPKDDARTHVLTFIKGLIEHNFIGVMCVCTGSLPAKICDLDSDVDISVVVPPDQLSLVGGEENFLATLAYFLSMESLKATDAGDSCGDGHPWGVTPLHIGKGGRGEADGASPPVLFFAVSFSSV